VQCSADADDDSFVYTTERQRQVPVALVGPRHCACRLCACARSDALPCMRTTSASSRVCAFLECRRRAESVVAIDRTDAAALAKPTRASAFCLALLSRPPSAKCATNTSTRRAQGMLCEACRTGATKAYRRSERRCALALALALPHQ
jgi:hypothetical protein